MQVNPSNFKMLLELNIYIFQTDLGAFKYEIYHDSFKGSKIVVTISMTALTILAHFWSLGK